MFQLLYHFLDAGDADGKGRIRKRELFQACATLKVTYNVVMVPPGCQNFFSNI